VNGRPGRRLAALAGAQLLVALDHNIVYVVLPVIDRELHFAGTSEQWVVSSYGLAFGGLLLVGGRLTDAFGPHDVFLAALAVYAGASALGGLAAAPGVLVAARACQGAGGALLFPATVAALKAGFAEGPERARALAAWGAAGAAGGAAGSLVGGTLATALGWRAVFLVNLPLAALVACAGWAAVSGLRAGRRRPPWRHLPAALAGALAVALALLASTQAAAAAWPGPAILAVLAAAVLLATAFRRLERCSGDPLVPAGALARGPAASAVAVAFAFMAAFGSQLYLLTVYLQESRGAGPLVAGAALVPLTAAVLAGTQLGTPLVLRLGGARATVAGLLGGAGGMVACAAAVAASSVAGLAAAMVVVGLGQGVTWTAMWSLATSGAGRGDGVVAGVVATAQQIGGAAGLALLVSVVAAARPALDRGIALSFLAAAALLAAVALLSPRLARARRLGCG
jgi:MFS family permease